MRLCAPPRAIAFRNAAFLFKAALRMFQRKIEAWKKKQYLELAIVRGGVAFLSYLPPTLPVVVKGLLSLRKSFLEVFLGAIKS